MNRRICGRGMYLVVALGLTWLAGRLHPELFPRLNMVAEAQSFYQNLYGLDAAFFEKNILPTFKGDLP